MRIGVYVGSFNPVHKGHVKIAQSIVEQNLVDQLWVIVTGNYWDKQDMMPIQKRIEMWKFYATERIIIDETHNEIEKTYQLFRVLKQQYPDDEFVLVVGADNLIHFDKWVNYEELLLNPFIVVKRDENGADEIAGIFEGYHKSNYTILDIDKMDISSSEIRAHLDDYDAISNMIDREIFDYLRDYALKA